MRSFAVLFLILYSTYVNSQSQLNALHYLIGEWKIVDKENNKEIIEVWSFEEDYYKGYSYTLNKGIKTFKEDMIIKIKNDKLVYSVRTQNREQWIDFTQEDTSSIITIVKFVNKNHDFPKYISYRPAGKNSVYAEIGDFEKITSYYNYKNISNDSIDIAKNLSLMKLKFHLGDMDGVSSFYAKDAKIIAGDSLIVGEKNIKNYWSLHEKGNWRLTPTWIKIEKNKAIQRGRSSFFYDGKRPNDKIDFLLNWIKKDGKWLILQEVFWW